MGLLLTAFLAAPQLASWCAEEGTLHIELGGAALELRDHRPVLSRQREGYQVPKLSMGRLFRGAHPVDRVDFRAPDGTERRLRIDGEGWKLLDGDGGLVKNLRVPNGFRRGVPPLLLGLGGRYAWFASSTHLARLDLAAERQFFSSSRLSRKSLEWIFVSAGARARFIDEQRVLDCEPNLRCEERLALAEPVESVATHPTGLLLATPSRVMRLAPAQEEPVQDAESSAPAAEALVDGRAGAMCGERGSGRVWIAIERDSSLELIRVGESMERFTLIDLLRRALPNANSDAAEAWADALVDAQWPARKSLAEAFSESKSPALRKVAALIWGGEKGNPALARLWLLGHDDDLEVRVSAVHASASWCRADSTMPCRAVLAAFINDPDDEVSWTARDLLLDEDPWAALQGAPVPYRLEAVSRLSSRLSMSGSPKVRSILERLAADADPSVRAAAQMAVIGE